MPNIYLTGARGSGKTTVGRLLAQKLDRPFTDLDHYLVQKTGHEIAEIIQQAGWPEFRRIENLCLAEVSGTGNQVIATGGGIILAPENRAILLNSGFVIWLTTDPETARQRLARNPETSQRPSLTGADPLAEIRQIMAEREPLYKSCCHCAIDGNGSPEDVCEAILARLAP